MKYLNTTANKHFAISCLLLFFGSSLFAQKTTNSPYSKYGIGLIRSANFNSNMGSGGIGYAWRPSIYKPQIYDSLARSNAKLNDRRTNYINLKNPASFSNISLTTFDVGLLSRNSEYTSQSQRKQDNSTGISHIAIAFPVGEKMGMGFGLRQYSSVGYEYQNSSSAGSIGSTNMYEGSGGVNELFLAGGYELGKTLSVGLTGKYLFGKIQDNKRVLFTAPYFFNTIDRTETDISSASLDIGIQYFKQLSSNYRLVLGAIVSPIDELNAEQTNLIATYIGATGSEKIKDTINFAENKKITVPFASAYGGGLSIEKIGKWTMELDVSTRIWSKSVELADKAKLSNALIVNAGFEKFNAVSSFGSYYKRMGYRVGFNYNSSLVNINGTDIDEMAVSLGFSLPLPKSFSTLSFGIELGKRGSSSKNLTEERYFNLLFGVTINDKWFIKRKYD